MSTFRNRIPISLTWFRLGLAPLCLADAYFQGPRLFYCVAAVLALLSDYFDGVLARRWGGVTPFLRRLDSLADACFYLAILICCLILEPEALRPHALGFSLIVMMEAMLYAVSYGRFKKAPANHAWLSKIWGLLLPLSASSLLSFQRAEPYLSLTVWMGLLAEFDGILIMSLLPRWQQDISSSVKAWAIRSASQSASTQ